MWHFPSQAFVLLNAAFCLTGAVGADKELFIAKLILQQWKSPFFVIRPWSRKQCGCAIYSRWLTWQSLEGGTIKNKGCTFGSEAVMEHNPIGCGRAMMRNKGQGRPKAVLRHICIGKSLMEIEF